MENTIENQPLEGADRPLGLARFLMLIVNIALTLVLAIVVGLKTDEWLVPLSIPTGLTLIFIFLIIADGKYAREKGWKE